VIFSEKKGQTIFYQISPQVTPPLIPLLKEVEKEQFAHKEKLD